MCAPLVAEGFNFKLTSVECWMLENTWPLGSHKVILVHGCNAISFIEFDSTLILCITARLTFVLYGVFLDGELSARFKQSVCNNALSLARSQCKILKEQQKVVSKVTTSVQCEFTGFLIVKHFDNTNFRPPNISETRLSVPVRFPGSRKAAIFHREWTRSSSVDTLAQWKPGLTDSTQADSVCVCFKERILTTK